MRLTWITDVHLEFPGKQGREEFYDTIAYQKPDHILITGDISNAVELQGHLFEMQEHVKTPIIFVMGNHDYYGGSIEEMREWAEDVRSGPYGADVFWAQDSIIFLNDSACIVGVDGWADGQLGDPKGSHILLNDWTLIDEMDSANIGRDRRKRLKMLKALGKADADILRPRLTEALGQFDHVYVMTHVPPWKAATWHNGSHSDDSWLPWFSCKAVGDCIEEVSALMPGKKITVLCGHTHGSGYSKISDDIEVYTGAATYYLPEVQLNFDIMEDGSYAKVQPTTKWEAENRD